MTKHFLFPLIFLLTAHSIYCCSIAKVPSPDYPNNFVILSARGNKKNASPYRKEAVKTNYYVFIGEVVGIVKATKAEVGENRRDAEGVKVKVTENIYSPQLISYYEVFPIGMGTDCSPQGETNIERYLPIGSQVRVFAFDATIYKKQSNADSIPRLETSFYNDGIIQRNDLEANFRVSANSNFDYSKFPIERPVTTEEKEDYYSNSQLIEFEKTKDLARLLGTTYKQKAERLEILKRLCFYPFPLALNYRSLIRIYLKPGKDLNELDMEWQRRKQEIVQKYK